MRQLCEGGIWEFYHVPRVDLHHPLAEGGSSYAVWETYDYTYDLLDEDDGIDWAVGYYYFDWRYRSDSDDVFAIRISATVEWYIWYSDPSSGEEYWECEGETELSMVISIVNYY